jgi:DNA-binding transcriptional regulator WhiA
MSRNYKYPFNFDVFKNINEDTAYWAGYLMADGSLEINDNTTRLHLVSTDKDQIIKYCDWIGVDKSAIRQHHNKFIIVVNRKGIELDLENWGIIKAKSYNFIEPKYPLLSQNIFNSYMKGVFDGDGYISIRKHKERIRITGNKNMMLWLKDNIALSGYEGNISIEDYKDNRPWCKITISGRNQVKNMIELLDIGNYSLDRKWAVIKKWIGN